MEPPAWLQQRNACKVYVWEHVICFLFDHARAVAGLKYSTAQTSVRNPCAEMLVQPIAHAASTCTSLDVAEDVVTNLMNACLAKHPVFSINRLSSMFSPDEGGPSSSGGSLISS